MLLHRRCGLHRTSESIPIRFNSRRSHSASGLPIRGTLRCLPVTAGENFISFAEVQGIAKKRGLCLYIRRLGPGYRIVCRDGNEDGQILGYTDGFIIPWTAYMHCDTLQVFTKGMKGDEGERIRGGPSGLGLLLGVATFSFGHENGIRDAEILAINDDEYTAKRLVRYYKYFGFEPIKEVGGNGLSDLPDLLVWGGVGTKMKADVHGMLNRWTEPLRKTTSDD